jgi:hypothetical protein
MLLCSIRNQNGEKAVIPIHNIQFIFESTDNQGPGTRIIVNPGNGVVVSDEPAETFWRILGGGIGVKEGRASSASS